MQISNIHQAKANLSGLIRRAIAGEEVVIARANEPLVRLEPVCRDTRPRTGGQWHERLLVSAEFDAADAEIESLFHDSPLLPTAKPEA